MRIRDILQFAFDGLKDLERYKSVDTSFTYVDNAAKQKLKTLCTEIEQKFKAEDQDPQKELKKNDYDRNYSFFYNGLVKSLKEISTTLVIKKNNHAYISSLGQGIKNLLPQLQLQMQDAQLAAEREVMVKQKELMLQQQEKAEQTLQREKELIQAEMARLTAEKEAQSRQEEERKRKAEKKKEKKAAKKQATDQQNAFLLSLAQKVDFLEAAQSSHTQQVAVLQSNLSLATQRANEMGALMQALFEHIPANLKNGFQEKIKQYGIEAKPNGSINASVTFVDHVPIAIKQKYLPDTKLQMTEALLQQQPYEGAKVNFSYFSPRRAVVATYLYRYTSRLMQPTSSRKHHEEYQEEIGLSQQQRLQIIERISACIFYLFMETDKSWQDMRNDTLNPMRGLLELTKKYNLPRLQRTLARIVGNASGQSSTVAYTMSVSEENPLLQLSDDLVMKENGKTVLRYVGKFGLTFFKHSALKDQKLENYCYSIYNQNGKKEHDRTELNSLYTIKI